MNLLGAIICKVKGHKRGKFVMGPVVMHGVILGGHKVYACPRCGRETRYKIKPKPSENRSASSDFDPVSVSDKQLAESKE